MDPNQKPRILLIGAGLFGKNYIPLLLKFSQEGYIDFSGIIVQTKESQQEISTKYSVPVWTELTPALLEKVDAVFIITPPNTHYTLAKQCLPYVDVFVEKPITEDFHTAQELQKDAERFGRILMVGHIFRFHPVIKKLKSLITKIDSAANIKGIFTNPIQTDNQRDISLEMLHYYDIIDFLYEREPLLCFGQCKERTQFIDIRYPDGLDAHLELGWTADEKTRTLEILSSQKRILCNFIKNTIEIFTIDKGNHSLSEIYSCISDRDPLEEEIHIFLQNIKRGKECPSYPDGNVGARIVKFATSISFLGNGSKKPSIAIIGGGIFGTNCAIELGKNYDVTLFEKNNGLLQEASFVNQYRHHWGYHYPRSQETVRDIIRSTKSFEALYNKAIIRNFPTYYCVAKEGSHVNAEQYIKFCTDNGLPFILEYPDPIYVNRNLITASLKTLEPIYDFDILSSLVHSYLSANKNIDIHFNSSVIGGSLEHDGKKTLVIQENGKIYNKQFDFVINVTYAHLNQFCHWFEFPIKPLRLQLVEALIVKLPIPKLSFAFMDGPFTNMAPTSQDNIFTLVHIKHSILHQDVPTKGTIPLAWKSFTSHEQLILEESRKWMPILKEAEVVEKRYIYRGVNAYREYDDARPSDIISHGFGCWSILGGKIINSVSAAHSIREEIDTFMNGTRTVNVSKAL